MMKLLFGNQLVIFIVDAVFSLAMITLSTFLAYQALRDGNITIGQAVAVVLLSTIMLEPLDRIGQFFYVGMGGLAAQRKARAFLAEKPAYQIISEEKRAADPTVHQDAAASAQPGAITLHNVTFAYSADDDAEQVLRNLNLDIAPVNMWAWSVPPGAEVTLAGLVLGDLVPRTGSVTVDEKIVGEVPAAQIRSGTAAVNQTTWLFTGSLADNLRIAKADATEEEMWHSLDTAALAEDVRTMPDGLNTEVGERGYYSPAAKPNVSPSPAPSSPTPPSWCSTNPPHTSTSTRKRPSSPPWKK
ncbi:MAG: ABC transporter ATP-binding protein [Lawsonella clevelandensis]